MPTGNLDLFINQGLLGPFLNIIIALVLALVVTLVYKRTHRGVSYSQSFVFTLVLLTILSALVMMVVENSLARAFAILGTFTIIRFRTAVKDTKDTAFILWAIIMGLAVGTYNYGIALIGTATIAIIVLILSRINFGSLRNYDHVLNFMVLAGESDQGVYNEVFDKYLKQSNLLHARSREQGKNIELTYNVQFFDDSKVSEFIKQLEAVSNISQVNIVVAKDDIEY